MEVTCLLSQTWRLNVAAIKSEAPVFEDSLMSRDGGFGIDPHVEDFEFLMREVGARSCGMLKRYRDGLLDVRSTNTHR